MCKLIDNIECWEKIETPEHIINWLKNGVNIPFISEPNQSEFKNYVTNKEEETFIDLKIVDHLNKGYVSKVVDKPVCVSAVGCTSKKGKEKYRLISDMRNVNQFIDIP